MSEVTTTDLYQVTMALSYLREGMYAPATFSLFVRDVPTGRGFLVAAGLEPSLDHLSRFHEPGRRGVDGHGRKHRIDVPR